MRTKVWLGLMSGLLSTTVFATPQNELVERLSLHKGFSANFQQTVTDADGDLVMEGSGTLDVLRPNRFRWSAVEPEENTLISDGSTLWYYHPFLEQVSLYSAQQAVEQTPFVLLTRNQESDWLRYQVRQQDNTFVLLPTDVESNTQQYSLTITDRGEITSLQVTEQDGQISRYDFSQSQLTAPNNKLFTFDIPEGVDVDDQRAN